MFIGMFKKDWKQMNEFRKSKFMKLKIQKSPKPTRTKGSYSLAKCVSGSNCPWPIHKGTQKAV